MERRLTGYNTWVGLFRLFLGRNHPQFFALLSLLNMTLTPQGKNSGSMRNTTHRRCAQGHTAGKAAKLKTNSGAFGPRALCDSDIVGRACH